MGWRIALIVGLVACGRVGFDARDGDTAGDGAGDTDGTPDDGDDGTDAGDGSDAIDGSSDGVPCATSPACEAAGGACVDGACLIEHTGFFLKSVRCPAGEPCRVICTGSGVCQGGVDCGGATTCDVTCKGTGACQGGVDCGSAATCVVSCSGDMGACQLGQITSGNGSVDCANSSCDVTCSGFVSCQDGISVGPTGMCTSHCCAGACMGGVDSCVNDTMCL